MPLPALSHVTQRRHFRIRTPAPPLHENMGQGLSSAATVAPGVYMKVMTVTRSTIGNLIEMSITALISKKWQLHFLDFSILKMFVQLYKLHFEEMFNGSTVCFSAYIEFQLHFNFSCPFNMNKPRSLFILNSKKCLFIIILILILTRHTHSKKGL